MLNLSKGAKGQPLWLMLGRVACVIALLPGLASAPAHAKSGAVLCVTPLGGVYEECDQVFTTIQEAVDAAAIEGDEIRMAAAEYTGVATRNEMNQVVYIDKSLLIQGGYTENNWTIPDPSFYATSVNAEGQGRAITVFGVLSRLVKVTINGLTLTGGYAKDANGGSDGGGLLVLGANVSLNENTVTGNLAVNGGGIAAQGATLYMTSNYITRNEARGEDASAGGGLNLHGSTATLYGNWFDHNSAKGVNTALGGALSADASSIVMDGNSFIANRAEGAAVFGGGVILANSTGYLYNSRINHNQALGVQHSQGGGLYVIASGTTSPTLGIANNLFLKNVVDAVAGDAIGAGVFVWGSGSNAEPVYLWQNWLAYNRVQAHASGSGLGGGIYVGESAAAVMGNWIERNVVHGGDEAFSVGGGLVLDHAGAYVTGNYIDRNWIGSEESVAAGGGLATIYSAAYLQDNILSRNGVASDLFGVGGGVYQLESLVTGGNSAVLYNSAPNLGSGLFIDNPSDLATELLHSTIHDNVNGDGTGIHLWQGQVQMTNTIIANQATGARAIRLSTLTLDNTLWWNNGQDTRGLGTFVINNPFTGDPLFAADGVHIEPGSAAIDLGLVTALTTDIDGDLRDALPDLGVDELVAEVAAAAVREAGPKPDDEEHTLPTLPEISEVPEALTDDQIRDDPNQSLADRIDKRDDLPPGEGAGDLGGGGDSPNDGNATNRQYLPVVTNR
jgi:hypothetical protein